MPPVKSSSIAAADYDQDNLELTITFHSGNQYTYSGVPEEVYQGLLAAPSAGAYYNANIKNNYG